MKGYIKMNSIVLKIASVIFINLFGAQKLCFCTSNLYFADELFNKGKYDAALTEYKRLNFFSPSDYFKYQTAICYQKSGDLHQSALIFKKLGANEELIQTYLQMEEYALARFVAQDLDKDLLGWIYLLEGKWNLAGENFPDEDLRANAKNGEKLLYKSVPLASFLSAIVPGTGEIYAKKWWQGAITLALNVIPATFAIKSFREKEYLGATLITVFLWSRFYQGGIENAIHSTKEYNRNLKDGHIKSISQKYKCPFKELK